MRSTLDAKQAADYLGVSYWLILELVKRGEVPVVRLGSRLLFRMETLDKWMASKEQERPKMARGGRR